jgi:hypothetical protein
MSERAVQMYLNQTWPKYQYQRRSWGHSVRARWRRRPRPSWLVRLSPPLWAKPVAPLMVEVGKDVADALEALNARLVAIRQS